jgi:formate-dependent nitrite reductase membrane component NrfD
VSVGRAGRVLGAAVSGCAIGTLQAVLLVGLLTNQKSNVRQSEPDTFDIFPGIYWFVGFLVVTGVLIPVLLRVLGNRWWRGAEWQLLG